MFLMALQTLGTYCRLEFPAPRVISNPKSSTFTSGVIFIFAGFKSR